MKSQSKHKLSRTSWKTPLYGMGPFLKIAMIGLGIAVLVALSFGILLDQAASRVSYGNPPPLKGMALGLFSKDLHYDYHQELSSMKKLGINAVLLMVTWYQSDIHSDRMEPRYDFQKKSPTIGDRRLEEIIQFAHGLDMKVLLFPYLRFEKRGPKDWRGILSPTNFSTWAHHYSRFILHYAELARKNNVEYLSVGSELGSLEDKTDFWLVLIKKVKKQFKGKLIYSANWDHYQFPTFWKELDAIGISSYYQLTEKSDPTLSELLIRWDEIKTKILNFRKQYPDKKIIITEVGYPSLLGASREPWNYVSGKVKSLEEQALCYQAFIETWNNTPELEGVFWWNWYGKGGPEDPGYTPRGKPAERLLKKWYGGEFTVPRI